MRGPAELVGDLDCSASPLAIGVVLQRTLYLNGHTIRGGAYGVYCGSRCRIKGPGTIEASGVGVEASREVILEGVTVTGNAVFGVAAARATVVDSAISGNGGFMLPGGALVGGGVTATSVRLRGSTVTGNFDFGVRARERLFAARSTITGNGTTPGCTYEDEVSGSCGDLVGDVAPRLSRSTCDVSVRLPSSTWGVCSADP